MALTSVLRNSSSGVISTGSQIYSRYLATAANRSHVIIPTSISSVRQFSSPSKKLSNSKEYSDDQIQQLISDEVLIDHIITELNSMKYELQLLRNDDNFNLMKKGYERIQKPRKVEVVKEKDPFVKEIESEMSKAEFSRRAHVRLLNGFEVECDKPGIDTITVKGKHKKEIIRIKVFRPRNAFSSNFKMPITVTVSTSPAAGFSAFFNNTTSAEIHCIVTKNRYVVDKIMDPSVDGNLYGVPFGELPENLRRELHNYLETRGVSSTTTTFLYEYMLNKISRENLRGLEPFMKIIDAA
ncbi:hypothetical protein POM88_003320 [Heracleum sosnowskyi]|uniref:Uncharacterized protein n=1 Tax=Heracleum sosnowskyi TaxID=360622 RepID=A0AAD8JFQ0_9APIA|nr:hypothetical protein POM88_003320 [Heracleum sosnowskyi]